MHTLARETIEATDGRIVEERVDPRRAFAGHALTTPWDRPHLAYPHDYREIAGSSCRPGAGCSGGDRTACPRRSP